MDFRLIMLENLQRKCAYWIVSKCLRTKKKYRGTAQWAEHWGLPLLCFFELRNFDTIQYAPYHRKFSYIIKQKFMKLYPLEDHNMEMFNLVGYPGPLRSTPVMLYVHTELSQNLSVQRSITGVNLNGPSYLINVHMFISDLVICKVSWTSVQSCRRICDVG
jgi:hypothetical protein